jgi:RNA polymerase sigma-70 factor (ECF subfamily)
LSVLKKIYLQGLISNAEVTEAPAVNIQTEAGFELTYKTYFKGLYTYALSIVRDNDTAEELTQQVFYKLWEKRNSILISESVRAYLYRSVYHESMNYLKHQKVRNTHSEYAMHQESYENTTLRNLEAKELENRLSSALNQLPEMCRTVFQLCRFEELKYREIAEKLNIPVKTVENQMGKALRLLRLNLADLLSLFILTLHWL